MAGRHSSPLNTALDLRKLFNLNQADAATQEPQQLVPPVFENDGALFRFAFERNIGLPVMNLPFSKTGGTSYGAPMAPPPRPAAQSSYSAQQGSFGGRPMAPPLRPTSQGDLGGQQVFVSLTQQSIQQQYPTYNQIKNHGENHIDRRFGSKVPDEHRTRRQQQIRRYHRDRKIRYDEREKSLNSRASELENSVNYLDFENTMLKSALENGNRELCDLKRDRQ